MLAGILDCTIVGIESGTPKGPRDRIDLGAAVSVAPLPEPPPDPKPVCEGPDEERPYWKEIPVYPGWYV